ncbi:MAG: indolepyruvate oxidoreductase subunit beta [bacterium]|nr:indolepyruvate oxidoreductase subunit beta [bacterium]
METTSILFAGVGGQGIILASQIVAQVAFSVGYVAKESEIHGMAQRGGSVVSHVRFGKEVYSPLIPKGNADYLVALEALEGLRNIDYVKPTATIIFNTRRVIPATANPGKIPYPENVLQQLIKSGFHTIEVNASGLAQNLGSQRVENIILLGALSRFLLFPVEAWERVIASNVPPKTIELNLAAFAQGRLAIQ